ncbi:hypothetical protein PSP6_810012 [Paraburkholderia tropica]|nr:hypothetical protein PSP6_810012 [Paraburkholderia tropica]
MLPSGRLAHGPAGLPILLLCAPIACEADGAPTQPSDNIGKCRGVEAPDGVRVAQPPPAATRVADAFARA